MIRRCLSWVGHGSYKYVGLQTRVNYGGFMLNIYKSYLGNDATRIQGMNKGIHSKKFLDHESRDTVSS